MRRLLAACLVLAPALSSALAPAASSTLVISEFRTRGPNGSTDEFVELFNKSAGPITLTGYRLMVSDSAGNTKPLAQIAQTVVLQPRQFYLLVNSLGYSGAVSQNDSYVENIPDDGGIALLTPGNAIVDQVGMSLTSAYVEGTPLDPTPTNVNQSYERNNGGCAATRDTDDNDFDFRFNATQSFPQNTAVNCNTCVGVNCVLPPNTQCWLPTGTCAAGSCTYTQRAVNFTCTDGDACTIGDKCDAAGVCVSGPAATCVTPPAAACSDPQTLVTYGSPGTCSSGAGCTYTPTSTHCQYGCNGTTKTCNPDPCSLLSCNTPPPNGCYDPVGGCLNGTCIYTAKQRNTPCTDGDACTTGDLCDASGTCLPGADIRDDGNPCTIDACNKTTGVVTHTNTPDGANCDDGNLCNGVETCKAGVCSAGTAVACVTPPPGGCYSSVGACSPASGICTYGLLGQATSCDDKNPCTGPDQCDGNGSCGGPSAVCTPPAPACLNSTTQRTFSGGSCQVGTGTCQFTTTDKACPFGCDTPSGLCTADPCIGVVCGAPPDSCHAAGVCSGGTCTFAVTPGASCDDADPCTSADQCSAGGACAGTPLLCNVQKPPVCVDGSTSRHFDVTGTCSGGTCTYAAIVPDANCPLGCDGVTGFCKADPCATKTCDAPPDQCHQALGTCDSATGTCSYELKPAASSCDDVNPCTENDACSDTGVCAGTSTCNKPPAPTCESATTSRQYDAAGTCSVLGVCVYAPTTPDTTCAAGCNSVTGLCNGDPCASTVCASPPGSCYLGTGTCLAGGTCDYAPLGVGVTCDDTNPCTDDDACDGTGHCVGTAIPSCMADGGSSPRVPDASSPRTDANGGGGAGAGGSSGGTSGAGGSADADGGPPGAGGRSTGGAKGTAGAKGSGGAVGVDGGATDGGVTPKSGDNGGCGCSVPGRTSGTPWALVVTALAVLAVRRKKATEPRRH